MLSSQLWVYGSVRAFQIRVVLLLLWKYLFTRKHLWGWSRPILFSPRGNQLSFLSMLSSKFLNFVLILTFFAVHAILTGSCFRQTIKCLRAIFNIRLLPKIILHVIFNFFLIFFDDKSQLLTNKIFFFDGKTSFAVDIKLNQFSNLLNLMFALKGSILW